MKCENCGKTNANVELKYMKKFFCKRCFSKFFENRVRRTIRKYNLLEKKDKVAVFLCNENSFVLLKILNKLSKKAPQSELIAISIISNNKNKKNENLKISEFCKRLNIKHFSYYFAKKNLYRFLIEKAINLKVNKLAIGDSLDDEIQNGLMNFILGIDNAVKENLNKKIIIIKPLRECPKEEISEYAKIHKIKIYKEHVEKNKLKKEIENIIEKIEKKHPGMKFQLLHSLDDLKKFLL